MALIWVETVCPVHGFERFKIKVIRKYNMKTDQIYPKFRTKPCEGLSCLYIGRHVNSEEVKDFVLEYLAQRERGMKIIKIRLDI